MIISVERLKTLCPNEFTGISDDALKMTLDGIEEVIRAYTNNNFQNRNVRLQASTSENKLNAVSPYISVGDTVQISQSDVNDGLFVVAEVDSENRTMTFDKNVFDHQFQLVTKIEYPNAVVQGVINMMKWEVTGREKVGIQSETISRHSTTYFNMDSSNQVMGYPVSLLGFLKPFMKAKF